MDRHSYIKPMLKAVTMQQQNLLTMSLEISGYQKAEEGFAQDDEEEETW